MESREQLEIDVHSDANGRGPISRRRREKLLLIKGHVDKRG